MPLKKSIQIAPSLLSADFSKLAEEIRAVEEGGAEFLHLDVMDGHFVPNITFGPLIVQAIARLTRLPLDVHLMIENPEKFLKDFVESGASFITVHVETCPNLKETLSRVGELGVKTGIALNPPTSLKEVREFLSEVDLVLLMTVHPGFGGQEFIPEVIPKIKELRREKKKGGYGFWIEVDGGINQETLPLVVGAGAEILVAGSAIFEAGNPKEAVLDLRKKILANF